MQQFENQSHHVRSPLPYFFLLFRLNDLYFLSPVSDSSSCLIHSTSKQSPRKGVLNLCHSVFQSRNLHLVLFITPLSFFFFICSFTSGGPVLAF